MLKVEVNQDEALPYTTYYLQATSFS